MAGLVPLAEIQFGGFTMQAYHQIVGQLARLRYRSRGRFHCPVTVRAAYGGGVRTPELHADSVEAPYAHAAGLTVVVPSNAADAKGLLASAVRDPDPVLVLEPIPCYRSTGDVPDGEHLVPLGHARVVREPQDAVIVTWGAMVDVACAAADAAHEARGAEVGVVDLRTLTPLDTETLVQVAERAGRVDRRARGTAHRRFRRRGGRDHPGGGLLLARGADPAGRGLRRRLRRAARRGLGAARRGAGGRRARPVPGRLSPMPDPAAPDAVLQYVLPDLGEGMAEAEIVQWQVAVGDHVTRDQIVVHVQTDKAEVELPVPASGTVTALGAAVGDVVPVGATLLDLVPDDGSGARGHPRPRVGSDAGTECDRRRRSVAASPGDRPVQAAPPVRKLARGARRRPRGGRPAPARPAG